MQKKNSPQKNNNNNVHKHILFACKIINSIKFIFFFYSIQSLHNFVVQNSIEILFFSNSKLYWHNRSDSLPFSPNSYSNMNTHTHRHKDWHVWPSIPQEWFLQPKKKGRVCSKKILFKKFFFVAQVCQCVLNYYYYVWAQVDILDYVRQND